MNQSFTELPPTASETTVLSFRKIIRSPAFEKDLKKLLKRFQTLEKDLEVFQKVQLVLFHKQGLDNGGIVRIEGLGQGTLPIFKARKFACRSLRGKGVQSGIRVIYSYAVELDQIQYIEIYYKGDQEKEAGIQKSTSSCASCRLRSCKSCPFLKITINVMHIQKVLSCKSC